MKDVIKLRELCFEPRTVTKPKTRSHEEATIERFQQDPDFAAEYLAAIQGDRDKDELLQAERLMAEAFPVDKS